MRKEINTKEKLKVLGHLPWILRDHPKTEREKGKEMERGGHSFRVYRACSLAKLSLNFLLKNRLFSKKKKKKFSLNKSLVFSESKIKLENSEECREHENKRENRLPLMGDHHVD